MSFLSLSWQVIISGYDPQYNSDIVISYVTVRFSYIQDVSFLSLGYGSDAVSSGLKSYSFTAGYKSSDAGDSFRNC